MIHTKLSGFAVYIRVSMKTGTKLKIVHFSNSVILHVICAKPVLKNSNERNTHWHHAWKYSSPFALLEIAFIIETMIESSKSGKSIGCSVAINNRLETSRHWWNLRPFLCGGLSAVAVHVNNAWSQIDSSSLSSPSTHWQPGLQAGAPLFPSSDWLCLEGSGGDGKSPAPFSHAVLAASAPHCLDLCVCCRHSTLGPLVNFSRGCSGTELSFGYLLSPQTFLKGKSAAQLRSQGPFSIFHPFLFIRQSALWSSVMQCRSCATITVASPSMFHTPIPPADPPTILPFTVFSFFFFFKIFWTFSFTRWRMVPVWGAPAAFSMIQPWEPRGLSASSHPGVSVGSPLKLGTQSSPPWSESLAVATHNPYSKGQLDWDHGAQGEQRDLAPPPTSHFPVTEYLRQLWHVKTETGLNSRHLATAL